MKIKTLESRIAITPSFLDKLKAPRGTPEHSYAARRVFEEMERIEREIKKQLQDALDDYSQGKLQWEESEETVQEETV